MFSQRKTVESRKCSNVRGRKNVRRRDVERDALGVGRYALGVGRDVFCQNAGKKMFKWRRPEKKSAWTGLDRVDFEKISSKSQCPNRKIGVDRSRQK